MEDMVTKLWEQYYLKQVQDGFLYMLKDGCPYRGAFGGWTAESQVIASLDFVVLLCDSLQRSLVEKHEVFRMFPSIGRALDAFEQSEYFKSRDCDRKITEAHVLIVENWKKYIR